MKVSISWAMLMTLLSWSGASERALAVALHVAWLLPYQSPGLAQSATAEWQGEMAHQVVPNSRCHHERAGFGSWSMDFCSRSATMGGTGVWAAS